MAYELEMRETVARLLEKIAKKDGAQTDAIKRKIREILADPYKFKPLKAPLQGYRRVHVMRSFVLVYSINEARKTITIERYKHHDEVYKC